MGYENLDVSDIISETMFKTQRNQQKKKKKNRTNVTATVPRPVCLVTGMQHEVK